MRLVVDMQGGQSASRNRGIGRYCRALVRAMAEARGPHELRIVLNGGFGDATEALRDEFAGVLPAGDVLVWRGPGEQTAGPAEHDARRTAAEHIRASVLASAGGHLLLLSSLFEGFSDDAVTGLPPETVLPPAVAICYDLIPMLRPAMYLTSPRAEQWYYRRLLQMKHAAGVLAISESSRQEAIDALGLPQDRVRNILAGVGPQFRPAVPGDEAPQAVAARYGLAPGFLLCIGAVEARKNLDGLIRAYARLDPALRARHRLVATGWNDSRQLGPLRALAAECGLGQDEVALLDAFVPEADLPGLYRASAAAVSPSLHEGFGLSAAEAMACGTPALGSNTTSLPEVIGDPEALFDPADPASIAARLDAVLSNPSLQTALSRQGLRRAQAFTWPETARRAWDALEAFAERAGVSSNAAPAPANTLGARKPRLACIAPLHGDTAAFARLLTGLARYYRIDLFSEDPAPAGERWIAACFPVLAPSRLCDAAYDRVLYFLADDPRMAVLAMRLLPAYPGVIAPGRAPLAGLLARAPGTDGAALLREALIEEHGWHAAIAAAREPADLTELPACDAVLARRAVGVLIPADQGRQHSLQQGLEQHAAAVRLADCAPSPHDAAAAWHDAIEQLYARGSGGGNAAFAACLAGIAAEGLPVEELPTVAAAAAATFRPPSRRALLLDASTISTYDAGTGIQRVVRETIRQLGLATGLDCRVEPVRQEGGRLLLARDFAMRLFGLPPPDAGLVPAEPATDDAYVALDLNLHDIDGLRRTLRHVRERGAKAYVVIYDVLPMQMPACFPEPVQTAFPRWLDTIGEHADGLICISRTVADDVVALLDARRPPRVRPLQIGWFHLGADFLPLDAGPPSGATDRDAPPGARNLAERRPALLMVGTVEPRKGHSEALDACEALWADGSDVELVIAGRPGWMMGSLVARLRAHPEAGRRLRWIEQATDGVVAQLYRSTDTLLMASEGEGFGLPLVEAARAGLPVIARDLPVFREVAGEHALYFGAGGERNLAEVLRRWLALRADGQAPDPSGIETISWAAASRRLADVALGESWHRTWMPPPSDGTGRGT